jgi:hypothetical protein
MQGFIPHIVSPTNRDFTGNYPAPIFFIFLQS